MSSLLPGAESRYDVTELEIARQVWVVQKSRYMVEACVEPAVICTDHAAIPGSAEQTSLNTVSVEKMKPRLQVQVEYRRRCFDAMELFRDSLVIHCYWTSLFAADGSLRAPRD